MKPIINLLGSMKTMALLMLTFAIAIGTATIIENDFGTQTAKAEVFNARWFEGLLLLLTINLIINMVRFKMFQKKKALIFMFHASFIIILIGAAITRYAGYEGIMHIREGEVENRITSAETYLSLDFTQGSEKYQFKTPLLLSKISDNSFKKEINVNGEKVTYELLKYIPNATYKIQPDENGHAIANMMITTSLGAQQIQMTKGDVVDAGAYVIDFESGQTFKRPVIHLSVVDGQLMMHHDMELTYLLMADKSNGTLAASDNEAVNVRTLYSFDKSSFVLRNFEPKAKKVLVSEEVKRMQRGTKDALVMKISRGEHSETLTVFGKKGVIGDGVHAKIGDMDVDVSYGAVVITLPFALKLNDFELQRYPGSNSPASYSSEVTLIDKANGVEMPFRIYMNHILDYQSYRFFQSSYDQDEKGTVLSVNNDPGTIPTYIGYFFLAMGLFISLLMPKGRFKTLLAKAKKASEARHALAALLVVLGLSVAPSHAKDIISTVKSFDKSHADKFGQLVVQDTSGRMKPMDTLSLEILSKLYRSNTIMGLNANQVVLGMMSRPEAWREIKMIRTSDVKINAIIGIEKGEKTAAFSQFFEFPVEISGYKLASYVDEAIRKAPGKRNKFDKAVLKVDERVNIAYMVYTGALLNIWPKPNDINNKWYDTVSALQKFPPHEGSKVRDIAVRYFTAMDDALATGDWSKADKALGEIAEYQKFYGAAVYPDEMKLKIETISNASNIFERLWPLYFLMGFVLLTLSFVQIIKPKFKLAMATKVGLGLLILFFIAHTLGLVMRWYISGHAPWSNGYESMIYIAWATVLAGFIFSKHSPMTLASTGILAGLILFVAHLNWMDPQVTNLVPVLQSYWLSIHVSMITASYGFLGLGALLGFITLVLFSVKNESNEKQISLSIQELNAINEMSLMIGLVLLTVGNFLGGVWANESWGRYWGWDPKETWALVTILVYAVVIHLRFIKAIYTQFMFSVISLLAFTSVLMTYFGVNYYLAGMHSYAKGDPVPIPEFVPWSYGIVFLFILFASRNRKLV